MAPCALRLGPNSSELHEVEAGFGIFVLRWQVAFSWQAVYRVAGEALFGVSSLRAYHADGNSGGGGGGSS